MPVTQQDIDNLTAAIASGERQVTIGSKSVTYRSISDLIAARDRLQDDLNAQSGRRNKQTRVYHGGRGYDR